MMLKKGFILLFLFLCFNSFGEADADRILARDDYHTYTYRDFETYLILENNVNKDIILEGDLKTGGVERTLALNALEFLAFNNLFFREYGNKTEDVVLSFLIRENMRNHAWSIQMKRLTQDCRITTPELTIAYEENKEYFKVEETRNISVLYKVFPEDEELSQALPETLKRLRSRHDFKENFIEYVKEYSDLPGAVEGGITGYFPRGTYGPIVEKYAFQTPKGEISPVFTATYGAYIIKCLDIKPSGYIPFSEVRFRLNRELLSKKRSAILHEWQEDLYKNNLIQIIDSLPESGPEDLTLMKVNHYELTSGTLFQAKPEYKRLLSKEPSHFHNILKNMAEKEAALQNFEKEMAQYPDSPIAREFETLEIITGSRVLLLRRAEEEIKVDESEMRDFYEKKRDFYHAPTPKRLSYVLFSFPEKEKLTEPEYYKKIEWLKRAAGNFRKTIIQNPASFEVEAEEISKRRKDVVFDKTDWVEQIPPRWEIKIPLTEFNVGKISDVTMTSQGLLIFKVAEQKKPRALPYENVKDQVKRVIKSGKTEALYKKIQTEILEKNHYKPVF